MRILCVLAAACVVAVGGCTTVLLPHPDLLPAMVLHVQCELKEARAALIGENPWLDKWAASFTITMKADQQASASPEVSLLGPFNVGTYVLPFGVGVSGGATRTATSKYTVRFDGLNLVDCNSPHWVFIDGTLGLQFWLTNVVKRHENGTFRVPDTIGHSVQYVVGASARVSPSYTLVRSKGSGVFSAARTDTDILDIAMTDASPKPVQHVIIDNFPSGSSAPSGRASRTFVPGGTQRTSPLMVRKRILNPGATISDDARQRLDNQLYELQLRSLFGR